MCLDGRSGTEWFAYYTGAFDDDRVAAASSLLRAGGVAVDAGANVGLWTVPLAREAQRSGASVLAFEPVPSNAARLRWNLALNQVQSCADVRQVALSDRAGEVSMSLREDFAQGAGTGNASFAIPDGDEAFVTVRVPTATLDEVVAGRGRPRVDVLKADVEGHEDRLLAGALETFLRDRPVAFVEWNPVYYRRRGVDPTAAVTPMRREWDYRSVRVCAGRPVTTDAFTSDKPLDDLVLVPAERQSEIEELLHDSFRRRP